MSVHLSRSLPSDDRNGLPAIAAPLIDTPDRTHVIVALVRTKEIRTVPSTGDVVPTAELVAIEAFNGAHPDASELERLLRRQHERRTGKIELPLELEKALDDLQPAESWDDETPADESGEQ